MSLSIRERILALLNDAGSSAFLRAMARGMANEGLLAIDELFAGERLAAAAITLLAAPTAFYWKIAYDQGLASTSPGLQLTWHLTNRLRGREGFTRFDSCAIAGNPLMRIAWRETMPAGDIAIPLLAPEGLKFDIARTRETGWRNFRNAAKQVAYKINGKKWS